MSTSTELDERHRAEAAQLERDLAALERHWRAMPWLALGFLACVPAGWVWGKSGAIVAALIVVYVLGVAIYITQGNLHRVRQHLDEVRAREKKRARGRRKKRRRARPADADAERE